MNDWMRFFCFFVSVFFPFPNGQHMQNIYDPKMIL